MLRVYDECEGTELDCNDDGDIDLTSALQLEAAAGESFLLVLDAITKGTSGTYVLDINDDLPSVATDGDLGSAVGDALASGTLIGTEDRTLDSVCGDAPGLDYAYAWQAPSTGSFVFDTEDSSVDTVVSLYGSDTCEVTELGCDDDSGGTAYTSSMALALEAGDAVYVRVAGYDLGTTGAWSLDINAL